MTTSYATARDPGGEQHPSDMRLNGFQECRPLLFAIAYRMLGSVMEAEDVLQDAYIRYCTAAPEQIRSLRPFLSTVVTRLCLDRLKSARAQRERYVGPWLPEPLLTADGEGWHVPGAQLDVDESVSMALLVVLETLTPVERAVFLLREVFDFGYDEIATMVRRREDACRQIFSRARRSIAERRPRFRSSAEERRRLTTGFLQAVTAGDVDGLTRLLAEDITFWSDGGGKAAPAALRTESGTASAALRPLHGRSAVARFILGIMRKVPQGFDVTPAEVNGSSGLIVRLNEIPLAVLALEMDGGQIREIRAVGNPEKLAHLRRPAALDV